MPQLGKYSTDRDCILHYMATCEWSNGSFGHVDSPTGYVWRITNTWNDVHPTNREFTSLIEDQVKAYDIVDDDDFRESLTGSFLVIEGSNGLVSVLQFDSERELMSVYSELERKYERWDSQDDE